MLRSVRVGDKTEGPSPKSLRVMTFIHPLTDRLDKELQRRQWDSDFALPPLVNQALMVLGIIIIISSS